MRAVSGGRLVEFIDDASLSSKGSPLYGFPFQTVPSYLEINDSYDDGRNCETTSNYHNKARLGDGTIHSCLAIFNEDES